MAPVWFQGHALEQRHYLEGVSGLYQETTARAAEGQGAGDSPEEARARQSTSDVEDTGKHTLSSDWKIMSEWLHHNRVVIRLLYYHNNIRKKTTVCVLCKEKG